MPSLKRRGFLQLLGAVGLAPLMPTLPASSVAGSSSASVSKALWASLYANSGSVSEFVGVAKNMGLSNSAIQGVSARSVGVRVSLAATERLVSAGSKSMPSPLGGEEEISQARRFVERSLERHFSEETDESLVAEVQDFEAQASDEVDKSGAVSELQVVKNSNIAL